MSRLQRFLAVLYPAALVSLVEALAVVLWGGVEQAYLPRLAGLALLAVLAGIALAGLAFSALRFRSPRAWLSAAWAVTAGLTTALVLANGAPPRFSAGSAAPGTAVFLVSVAGLLAGLVRFVLPRPVDRGRALLLEPALLVAVTAGCYAVLRRLDIPTGALRTLLPWAAVVALTAGLLAVLASRGRPDELDGPADRRLPWRERLARADGSTRAALSIVLWIAAAAAAAAALGRTPFEPMNPRRVDGPPDVLLVVLDTVRADALAKRLTPEFILPASVPFPAGRSRNRAEALAAATSFGSPSLAAFGVESRRFVQAYSTSCWTVPAHASLFTGMDAARHGVAWANPYLPAELPSLVSRLQDAGRDTAGFSANPWIAPEFRFDRGFTRFTAGDMERRPWIPWLFALVPIAAEQVDATLLWEDKDGLVLASEAMRALSQASRPAFVFLNLMEAHLPYAPPTRYLRRGLAGDTDLAELRALPQDPLMDLDPGFHWSATHLAGLRVLYAAEVAYLDDLFARMLHRLRQSGRLESTVVVIVSDHGENLGEHAPLDHQLGLWDTLVHVPLIVHLPDGRGHGEVDTRLVSLADLPDAIEAWAGGRASALDGPPARDAVYFDYDLPQPILERIRDRLGIDPTAWARSLSGIRTATAKWVAGSAGPPLEGGELSPETVALRERLASVEASRPERPAPPTTALSPEAEARLRSLGYVK
jgi:arylsulfatase A-like enzyme